MKHALTGSVSDGSLVGGAAASGDTRLTTPHAGARICAMSASNGNKADTALKFEEVRKLCEDHVHTRYFHHHFFLSWLNLESYLHVLNS